MCLRAEKFCGMNLIVNGSVFSKPEGKECKNMHFSKVVLNAYSFQAV